MCSCGYENTANNLGNNQPLIRIKAFSGIPTLGPSSLSRTYTYQCRHLVSCLKRQDLKSRSTREGYCILQWRGRLYANLLATVHLVNCVQVLICVVANMSHMSHILPMNIYIYVYRHSRNSTIMEFVQKREPLLGWALTRTSLYKKVQGNLY